MECLNNKVHAYFVLGKINTIRIRIIIYNV